MELIEKLIHFAKANHEGFADVPDEFLRRFFTLYQKTTIVNFDGSEIRGFGVYQEWPDLVNFICMVGNPEQDVQKNIIAMMDARCLMPAGKRIVYFDETKMELREICQQ